MADFTTWKVPFLQKYLKERGVTYTGKRKQFLIELCQACSAIPLETDPDFNCHDSLTDQRDTLTALNINDPFASNDAFINDLSDLPPIGLYDIFNYLLETPADYDVKKLKAYKSADDYKLYSGGAVEDLTYSANGEHALGIVKARVKPTQKNLWFVGCIKERGWHSGLYKMCLPRRC